MTKVFIFEASKLNNDITVYENCVSRYRFEKAQRLKNISDKKLCISTELLLAQYLDRIPRYNIDEYGKPIGEEVCFNFSHSANVAVCAVSDSPVGVDVEKIRNVSMDVPKRKFTEKEYRRILNSKNPQDTFFEYWVKKESYVKALGKGMKIPFNSFDADEITDWIFDLYDFNEYKISVCAKEKAEYIIKERAF